MDDTTFQAGLLLDAAEKQSKFANQMLVRLQSVTSELEPSVREAV